MDRGIDSRIQAQVRILLARRWVDLRGVTIGTTNGVVYIGGRLVPSVKAAGSPAEVRARWLERVRREIAGIAEVRDVVFRLSDEEGAAEGWRRQA